MQLMTLHGTHSNSRSLIKLQDERLKYFKERRLPYKEYKAAMGDVEQSLQFYSGMENVLSESLLMGPYLSERLPSPVRVFTKEERNQRIVFKRKKPDEDREETLRGQLELRAQEHLKTYSFELSFFRRQIQQIFVQPQRNLYEVLKQAEGLMTQAQFNSAYQLLTSIANLLTGAYPPKFHSDYYSLKAQICLKMWKPEEAYDNCAKAIFHNDRLYSGPRERMTGIKLRSMQVMICNLRNERERSIEILASIRSIILSDRRKDFTKIALNYNETVKLLIEVGRLREAAEFCRKVLELEQRRHSVSSEAVSAHYSLAQVAGKLKLPILELEQYWRTMEKVDSFESEIFSASYSFLLKSCKTAFNESAVGSEVMSFISYVRRSARPLPKGNMHADELRLKPIPTGLLPFDMSATRFVEEAETRLRILHQTQHLPCLLLKQRLLRIMESKFR